MAAVITFDYAAWIVAFPEFANIGEPLAQTYFNRAGFITPNSVLNPMNATEGLLAEALNLLTAHLAWISAPRDAAGQPTSSGAANTGIVGRISSASEGSVSVSTEWSGSGSPSEAWFLQSQYGATYWQLTAGFRTFRYVANPTIIPSVVYPYRRGVRFF